MIEFLSKKCFELSRSWKLKLTELKRVRKIKEQNTGETQIWLTWRIIFFMFGTGFLLGLGMKCQSPVTDAHK
jgi:hypothetical protein